MSFKTAPVHQGYIEPHACLARFDADGQAEIWASSQGHFVVRAYTAQLLGMKIGDLRVHPAEIGGGFGGKTVVYVEPVAVVLSRKSGHPVKIMMSREDVFKATGPTSGASMTIKIGVTKDGKIVAADGLFKYQAGAFPGSPVMNGCMCGFAPYDIANVRTVGYDVVCNRPKIGGLSRAGLADLGLRGGERASTWLRAKIGMDPLAVRLKNVAKPGTPTGLRAEASRMTAIAETLAGAAAASRLHEAARQEPGTRRRLGLLVQRRRRIERDRARQRGRHGGRRDRQPGHRRLARLDGASWRPRRWASTTTRCGRSSPTPTRSATRRSPAARASPSRPARAVVDACKKVIDELCARAAMIWKIDAEDVIWEDGARQAGGQAMPASSSRCRSRRSPPSATATGGPIVAAASVNADGQAPGFASAVLRRRGRSRDGHGEDPALRRRAGRRAAPSIRAMSRGRSRAASCRASAGR